MSPFLSRPLKKVTHIHKLDAVDLGYFRPNSNFSALEVLAEV